MFFYIPNLSASVVSRGGPPWTVDAHGPTVSFESKAEFRQWCKLDSTNHHFYSLYEGTNPFERISDNNPAVKMYGLVVDYDGETMESDWEAALKRFSKDFPPAYGSITHSGNSRLVWLFEEPVPVFVKSAHEKFLERLKRELKLTKILPGFDKVAFESVALTFELGRQWRKLSDEVIPLATLHTWLFESGAKANWVSSGEVVVPIEKVHEAVTKKFPGRWKGDFLVGVRGCRFWDATSSDDSGAVVRENGMQYFTDGGGFMTWRQIFGQRFVEEYQEGRISAAVSEIYFDQRHYWRKTSNAMWKSSNKEDMALYLKVRCGLRSQPNARETSSEVEQALYYIQEHNQIHAALPLVHQTPGLTKRQGEIILNYSWRRCVAPAVDSQEWGNKFPFIASLLTGFFEPEYPQRDRVFAWLKRFYSTALDANVQKCQTLFIAGKADRGKTLFSNTLVGELVGGAFDVSSILLGESQFNNTAFEYPLWTVDDSTPGTDLKKHATFSANVKKFAANQSFEFAAKFRDSKRIEYRCPAVVTLNDDPESMRIIPDAEISTLDKVMFLRLSDRTFTFPPMAHEVIKPELPFFGRWLLDWEVPEHCIGGARFGVKPHHEPALLDEARRAGRSAEFRELLGMFRKSYFNVFKDAEHWEGTSAELIATMSMEPGLGEMLKQQRMSPSNAGRELRKLEAIGYSVTSRFMDGDKLWTISKAGGAFKMEEKS